LHVVTGNNGRQNRQRRRRAGSVDGRVQLSRRHQPPPNPRAVRTPTGHVIGVTAMIGPVPVPGGIPRSAKSRLHLYLPN
jgi:hypothetical protein